MKFKLSAILTFTIVLAVCVSVQSEPNLNEITYPSGIIIGFGVGSAKYTTKWKLSDPNSVIEIPPELQIPPVHIHNKYELMGFMENRSVFNAGALHLDVRGEIRWGVLGVIEQDYLLEPPKTITDKGMNFTGGAHFKAAFAFPLSPRMSAAPFLGIGLCFSYLQAKGSGLKPQYSQDKYLDRSYKIGWTEFAVFVPASVGINLDFPSFSISPEIRYMGYGQASSHLQGTPEISASSMNYYAGMITIGFRR